MVMMTKFLIYGVMGWCMEIIWTGFNSLLKKDFKLNANTSLWMFFIYGMAIFLEPTYELLIKLPFIVRGGIYVICIFFAEYVTGCLLKKVNACPWDYSDSRYNINGIIRLDYAPLWFIAGLIFEGVHRAF